MGVGMVGTPGLVLRRWPMWAAPRAPLVAQAWVSKPTLNMTSSTSHTNYVYVIIILKMSESVNGIVGSLFCHYGETDDAFLIGG